MSSPFWRYFHERLNWPAIFHPGPVSALVKGLALYLDDVREDILWLRRQWNPATADEEMIAQYGASRGILRTRFDTDESYRLRVVNAYAWHRLGGKVNGLIQILAENGFHGAVIVPVTGARCHDGTLLHDGTQTYRCGSTWAQFDVILVEIPEAGLNAEIIAWFRWLINEYKPARSILRALSWRTSMEDETDFSDEAWISVQPSFRDIRPWGFPRHDGTIRYNNGTRRRHDGRLTYGGTVPHTGWEASGYRHDARLDVLETAVCPILLDTVTYTPRHNGVLRYRGEARHGPMSAPQETLETYLNSRLDERVETTDELEETALVAAFRDEIGLYHDGSITHGQQYINLYNGKIFHDGSRRRGPYGGNANFRPVLHDGWARRGEARHSIWGWNDEAGDKGPIFTYGALADSCAMTAQSTMEDSLELSDSMEIEIVRYTLHDGEAKHDGKTRYGGEEVRQ